MTMRVAMVENSLSGTGLHALLAARSLGVETVLLTREAARYQVDLVASRVLASYVDELVECETNDVASVVAALAARRVDAVGTCREYYVEVAALAARRLGLPGPDPRAVRRARNKDATRAACAAAGVPAPAFAVVADPAQAVRAADRIGYPCVVKPTDQAGSVDVAACFDADQVRRQVTRILGAERNHHGQRRRPAVLVEGYLTGPEVSVETITYDGRTTVVGVTDKQLGSLPHFVEMGHASPSSLPADTVAACRRTAVAALDAIGYDLGVAHVEIKATPTGARLIEINLRPGSDRIPDLVQHSTGVSLTRVALQLSLGLTPDPVVAASRGAAAVRFLMVPPGRVAGIHGEHAARNAPGVLDHANHVAVGDVVGQLLDAHQRAAHVIATGPTTDQARGAAQYALDQLIVRTEPLVAAAAAPAGLVGGG
jgi:biotin carboxylase